MAKTNSKSTKDLLSEPKAKKGRKQKSQAEENVEVKKDEMAIEPINIGEIEFEEIDKNEEPSPIVEEQLPIVVEEKPKEVKKEPEKPKSTFNMMKQYFTNFWNGMAMDD